MKSTGWLHNFSDRHKNKLMVLAVVAGVLVGVLVVFEKTIMKYAHGFFGGC